MQRFPLKQCLVWLSSRWRLNFYWCWRLKKKKKRACSTYIWKLFWKYRRDDIAKSADYMKTRSPSQESWKRQRQLRGNHWSCAFHSSPLTSQVAPSSSAHPPCCRSGHSLASLPCSLFKWVRSETLLKSVPWRHQISCCVSCVCSPAVAGGYSGPLCVIVLLVDIKSRAMLARRGCAFVLTRWRERAIVRHPSSIYQLTLSTTVHLLCLSLWVSPSSPRAVCVCVWGGVSVCMWERRRAPWCDAFFIQPAVLFSLSHGHRCLFIIILLRTVATFIHPVLNLTLTPSSI